MSKIYMEVPNSTNQTTISIPFDEIGSESLWQFTVIFNENEYLKNRIVTIIDNNCIDDDKELQIQSKFITNDGNRLAVFDYNINHLKESNDEYKASIKFTIHYSKECKIISVEW